MIRALYITLTALLLTACVSASAPPRPATEEAAIAWNRRGQEAFNRGDWRDALAAHEQALRQYASIENADGIAMESLNVATVQYRLGDVAAANAMLGRLLDENSSIVPSHYRAEAAYRRALIDFDSGDTASASTWLERATSHCASSACDAVGRLHNLRARAALARADLDVAEIEARRGLEINRGRSDTAEQANSLRLLAQTNMHRGLAPQSYVYYEQALVLDKHIGEPRKIGLDLLGLANSLAAQKRHDEAAAYFRRAADVARSSGDLALVREAEEGLIRVKR